MLPAPDEPSAMLDGGASNKSAGLLYLLPPPPARKSISVQEADSDETTMTWPGKRSAVVADSDLERSMGEAVERKMTLFAES